MQAFEVSDIGRVFDLCPLEKEHLRNVTYLGDLGPARDLIEHRSRADTAGEQVVLLGGPEVEM